MNWKPNAAEKRLLRAAAATEALLKSSQITLQPALRHPVNLTRADLPENVPTESFNDWMWGDDRMTDLYDNGFTMRDFEQLGGAPMNREGKARVDFYVYQLGNNGFGIEPVELVCNVAAIIETVNGKPRMVRVESRGGTSMSNAQNATPPTTIDMTPTWEQTARLLVFALENGTPEGKRMAREEIERMGILLDRLTESKGVGVDAK